MPQAHQQYSIQNRQAETASLADLHVVLRRRFGLIAWTAGPIMAAIAGLALGWPSVYESRAVMRLDQDLGHDTYAEYYVQTLQQQVLTEANLAAWVEQFELYPEEAGEADRIDRLLSHLSTEIVRTIVTDPVSGRERDLVTGFTVSYRSKSPEEAQSVAAAAAKAFVDIEQSSQEENGRRRIVFFSREAKQYRQRIAEVEAQLAGFKEVNGRGLPELVEVNMGAMDRIDRDMEAVQLQIDNLRRERVILQSQLNQVPNASEEALDQLATLQNEYVRLTSIYQQHHPSVVSVQKQIELLSHRVGSEAAIPLLMEQRDNLAARLAEARERYSEDHPDVRSLARAEQSINARIYELSGAERNDRPQVVSGNDLYVQLDTQIQAIDTQIVGLNDRIEELRARRDEYERMVLQAPQVERDYQELLRDLENARRMYEETQGKQREAELAVALETGGQGERLRLARGASFPLAPAWPPRAALLIVGFIVAVSAGVGLAAIKEIASGAVRGSHDARQLCGGPPIALIPRLSNSGDRLSRRLRAAGLAAAVLALAIVSYQGSQGLS